MSLGARRIHFASDCVVCPPVGLPVPRGALRFLPPFVVWLSLLHLHPGFEVLILAKSGWVGSISVIWRKKKKKKRRQENAQSVL